MTGVENYKPKKHPTFGNIIKRLTNRNLRKWAYDTLSGHFTQVLLCCAFLLSSLKVAWLRLRAGLGPEIIMALAMEEWSRQLVSNFLFSIIDETNSQRQKKFEIEIPENVRSVPSSLKSPNSGLIAHRLAFQLTDTPDRDAISPPTPGDLTDLVNPHVRFRAKGTDPTSRLCWDGGLCLHDGHVVHVCEARDSDEIFSQNKYRIYHPSETGSSCFSRPDSGA